ncbi:MAG: gliding motility-associated C-terminal domain-containing protein [Candidatus Cloacimonetes bacterium]|nr:gliding motility-associated C-terminal domain-containing protein [Candidatus Cloacimonadota bacterium]MCF7814798.1 gliding motility-associated C-terminal domain-containing protein [Candidatus Cloacimonadota bacterium]MCF7869207.1 gliding motility-associated C-terminal domain-containing protein [Candidatus Cloacimonadota bacterium]MCF7884634.1 gliding motility-associated C-terminal domain-containing protein [Candidatus Cloacimonadota bacterium]
MTGKNYENYDVLAIKTDSYGDSLWTRTFAGLGGNDKGNCVLEDNESNIIIAGELHYRAIDTFIAKIDNSGNILFEQILSDLAACYTIQLDQNNLIGYSWGGSPNQKTRLFKVDDIGEIVWNEQLNHWPSVGDKSFDVLDNEGFICAGEEYLGVNIFLSKTDSAGQITDSEENLYPIHDNSLSNYPNPFNPSTTIYFGKLENYNDYKLQIYNSKGQLIKKISIDCNKQSTIWDGTNQFNKKVGSGIYYYQLISKKNSLGTGKMLMLK